MSPHRRKWPLLFVVVEKSAEGSALFSRRVAKRVRELREARKWSRERLAQELAGAGSHSLGANGIYKIEQYPDPARRLTVDELAGLAIVLDTTPHALMGWDELVDGMAGWNGPDQPVTVDELQHFDEDPRPDLTSLKARMVELVIELKQAEREYDDAAAAIALVEGMPADEVLTAAVDANLRQTDLRREIAHVTMAIASLAEDARG